MATLSELVKIVAAVEGLDENQVLWIARYLREDGLITKGGRGRGGARMSIDDAANLLLGVNSPGTAKQSADLVRSMGEMPLVIDYAAPQNESEWNDLRSGDAFSEAFRKGNHLSVVLKFLIAENMNAPLLNDESTEDIRVTLSGPDLSALVVIGNAGADNVGEIWSSSKFSNSFEMIDGRGEVPDQQVSKTFSHRTIKSVARLITR